MTLCFIDTETTGLDPRIHQPYEVCWWREDMDEPRTLHLPHSLDYADGTALRIGGYFDRGMEPFRDSGHCRNELLAALADVTLVGSNPAFDAAMLANFVGHAVWHHRMIDVSNVAMMVLDRPRPMGLAEIQEWLANSAGIEVPIPDHTAEGDVRTTRAVYESLRQLHREAVR